MVKCLPAKPNSDPDKSISSALSLKHQSLPSDSHARFLILALLLRSVSSSQETKVILIGRES